MKTRHPLDSWAKKIVPPRLLKYQIAWRNYQRGEAEIRLLKNLVNKHKCAIDIGAYLGAYTFFLARLATHVYAFEPQDQCVSFLTRAYSAGVTVHKVALADEAGEAKLHIPNNQGSCSQAARLDAEAGVGTLAADYATRCVPVKRLDDYAIDNVGFIKIDAEGAERRILLGAHATLARNRPTLLIEIEDRHIDEDIDAIFTLLTTLGYQGEYWHNELKPIATFDVDAMQCRRLRGDRHAPYINNFIFTPIA